MYYLKKVNVRTTCWQSFVSYYIDVVGESEGMTKEEYNRKTQDSLHRVDIVDGKWYGYGSKVDASKLRKLAYVFLSYGSPKPAIVAAERCRRLVPNTDIDIIISRLGDPIHEIPNGVIQRQISYPKTLGHYQWKWSIAKFYPALWYEYEVVIVLDTDIILLKPLNELLADPPSIGKVYAPEAYWLNDVYSTGLLVFSPYNNTPLDSSIKAVLEKHNSFSNEDMDWFNKDLKKFVVSIDSMYTMLVGEFYPPDKIYMYHAKKWNTTLDKTLSRTPLVHAVANWKPWLHGGKYNDNKYLQRIYNIWKQHF